MLLVNVQNPKDKTSKVCVVSSEFICTFLEQYVPADCVALVQDVLLYDGNSISQFRDKWYGKEK